MSRKFPKTLEYQGKTQTLREWVAETGISDTTIRHRIKLGWPVDRTLTEPATMGRRKKSADASLIGKQLGNGLFVKEKVGHSNHYRVENADGSKTWVVPAYRLRNPENLRMSGESPIRERYFVTSPHDALEVGVVNLNTFCEGMGLDFQSMLNVAAGLQKSHKGWKCRAA